MRYSRGQTRPVRPATFAVAVEGRFDEAGSFVGLAVGVRGLLWGRRRVITPGEAFVVEALRKEDDISDGVVDSEDDLWTSVSMLDSPGKAEEANHGGQHALEDGAEDVEDIAHKPHDYELNGQGIGALSLEVLDDLG